MSEKDDQLTPPSFEKPSGVPADFGDYAKLMFDLMLVAFQTGTTRVATFMLGREGSLRAYREIGISDAHHPITHHSGHPDLIEKVARINTYHVEQFAYFLGKLKSTPDGDGTLLDHTLILWASNMGDSNLHSHKDVGHMLIGGANGQHKGGRHIRAEGSTANLLLATLQMFGVEKQSLGDSTGPLSLT